MNKNLTNSYSDRQAILNNSYLIQKIEEHFNFNECFWYDRLIYKDASVITKQQLSRFFDVSKITIKKYLLTQSEEIKINGYKVLTGTTLQDFILKYAAKIPDFNICNNYSARTKSSIDVLEVFTFKACINIAMLLSESERAKFIRSQILDIAIELAAEHEGGRVKYINRQIKYIFPASSRTFYTCSK